MSIQLWFRLSALLTAVALLHTSAPATTSRSELDTAISQAKEAGAPSGAFALLRDGAVVQVETFGEANPDSVFLWGSVSKPVAASIARELESQGRLDPNAPAAQYAPGSTEASVRHLVNHTSGLGFGAKELDVDRPRANARDVVVDHPATSTAGGYQYSSLGYLHLQAVLESASGGSYHSLVSESLPGAGASQEFCEHRIQGHRLAGPIALPLDSGYDGAGGAYGYTCGDIGTLAAFAQQHVRDPDLTDVVDTGQHEQQYAGGWRLTREDDGHLTHWHTGTVPGYFSAIHLDISSGDGTAMLLNASGYLHEQELASVARAAFDRSTDRKPATEAGSFAATLIPTALAGSAVLVMAAGFRWRTRRAALTWTALLTALTSSGVGLLMWSGYPARYLWLWEPGTLVAAGTLVLALLLAATASLCRLRPTAASGRP